MDINFEEVLENGTWDELNKLKAWLFRENIRVATVAKELEQMQEDLEVEKEKFQREVKAENSRIEGERKRIKADNQFFEKKLEILQNGFAQLDMDRRRLEKEMHKFEAQKEFFEPQVYGGGGCRDVSVFFRGVKNPLALKKRYKDLIKIFHPDNVAGDKEIIQMINREYDNIKRDYDTGKWA
ncbi:MAG: hypothetical protein J1D87_11185 [Lachnospiraceae bacterium]|nr:hypothetical protein [Lachnospiraceae bacterium]